MRRGGYPLYGLPAAMQVVISRVRVISGGTSLPYPFVPKETWTSVAHLGHGGPVDERRDASMGVTASTETGTVWIVEDSAEYREAVQGLINDPADLRLSCRKAFSTGEELLEQLDRRGPPELMLVDIGLPGIDGIEVVRRAKALSPTTQMIMLTIHEDNARVFEAICAGAVGYLLKTATPTEIVAALLEARGGGAPMTPQIARRVLRLFTELRGSQGDYGLTNREREVLGHLVGGKTKKGIGKDLFLSPHTVDTHMRNIYTKLHVSSRTEAAVKALREGLCEFN